MTQLRHSRRAHFIALLATALGLLLNLGHIEAQGENHRESFAAQAIEAFLVRDNDHGAHEHAPAKTAPECPVCWSSSQSAGAVAPVAPELTVTVSEYGFVWPAAPEILVYQRPFHAYNGRAPPLV